MKKFVLSVLAVALLTSFTAVAQKATNKSQTEPPKRGIHWAKGFAPNRGGGSPLLAGHRVPIMTPAATAALFGGPSWVPNPGDKGSGMDTWYSGFGNSN